MIVSLLTASLEQSHGHTNVATWTQMRSPLVTHRSCLVTSLATSPRPRVQHQPESSRTAQARAGGVSTRWIVAVSSPGSTRLCAGALSPPTPHQPWGGCTASCPLHCLLPCARCIPALVGTASCTRLCCAVTPAVSLRLPFSPPTTKPDLLAAFFTACH